MKRSSCILFVILVCCSATRGQSSDFHDTDFSKADSIAERFPAYPLADLRGLANKLTVPLHTEQEKFRAIYRWVCLNIEVDYELLTLNKIKRVKLRGDKLSQWNKKVNTLVFTALLSEHKTICTGYAYLLRELAFHAGLACEIVNGYANPRGVDARDLRPINHSWNLVRLNNTWYVCDATWSSGYFNLATGRFVKTYNDLYFLTEPSVFYESHDSNCTLAIMNAVSQPSE